MAKLGVLLDSNIFLQFQDIDSIDWLAVMGTSEIDLLICITVIDELDEKKNSGNSRQQKRARAVFKSLERWVFSDSPEAIRPNIFLRITREVTSSWLESHGFDPSKPDHQIIGTGLFLKKEGDYDEVVVVTGDNGLRARARAVGKLKVIQLSEKYELPPVEDSLVKENRLLKNELLQIQNARPNLKLVFNNYKSSLTLAAKEYRQLSPDDVEAEMTLIKQRYPKKELGEARTGSKAEKGSFEDSIQKYLESSENWGQNKSQWDSYDSKLDQFYIDYENYLYDRDKYQEIENRTFCIELFIENDGGAPATDVDVWGHFPDGFELFSDDDVEEPPEAPRPPSRPRGVMEIIRDINSVGLQNLNYSPKLYGHIRPQKINVHRPSIKETNSWEIEQKVEKLKHKQMLRLGEYYIRFPKFEAITSFQIDYTIHATEVPKPEEGILSLSFEFN